MSMTETGQPQRKNNKGMNAHFSFGNDTPAKHSSYQSDFGMDFSYHPIVKTRKTEPPKQAQILPEMDRHMEKCKWVSSSMRDFEGFGECSRRTAYKNCKHGFDETKGIHTKYMGLLKDNYRLPLNSRYGLDFRQPGTCAPQIPDSTVITSNALKTLRNKWTERQSIVSEARHAFQWPSADRIRNPLRFTTE